VDANTILLPSASSGAGGIGLQLSEQIHTYDFDQVAFIILLILAAVGTIDWVSGRLRRAMIGRRPKTG
jgi:phosphonate transport system permease protein